MKSIQQDTLLDALTEVLNDVAGRQMLNQRTVDSDALKCLPNSPKISSYTS